MEQNIDLQQVGPAQAGTHNPCLQVMAGPVLLKIKFGVFIEKPVALGPGLRRDDQERHHQSIGRPVSLTISCTSQSDILPVGGFLRSVSNLRIAAWVSGPTLPVGFSWP